jgi:acyl dehydratase
VPPLTVHIRDLADLDPGHLGHSDWHEITQRQVDLFAEATWDQQWIHVDPERAASGPYGGTIAHGFLIIGLTPALLAEIVRFDGVDMLVNSGLTDVRLRAPVPVGARVRMGAELRQVRARPRDYVEARLGLAFSSVHGNHDRTAATAELVLLLHATSQVDSQLDPASHHRRDTA